MQEKCDSGMIRGWIKLEYKRKYYKFTEMLHFYED